MIDRCPRCGRVKAATSYCIGPDTCAAHLELPTASIAVLASQSCRDEARRGFIDLTGERYRDQRESLAQFPEPPYPGQRPKTFEELKDAVNTATEKAAEALHDQVVNMARDLLLAGSDGDSVRISLTRHVENGGERQVIVLRLNKEGDRT
jgi:hypothetical protein